VTEVDATVEEPREQDRAFARRNGAAATALAKRLGLRLVAADSLAIRRRRCGKGWCYLDRDRRVIRDRATVRRLARLAVPPAYDDVLYAEDPAAHLQAVGRDAAGRLQYRYHPEWEKVRELRKARRLARLADVLPRIRRSIAQHLAGDAPTREFTSAAVIELVARSAIRPGNERYARLRGTRGAATLLKSNVALYGETITLTFRSKGGKTLVKEFVAPRLAAAFVMLRQLPGRRLFQYRAESGDVRHVTAADVNAFLRELAGVRISLKDFRTLLASASVLETLARTEPAASERRRRRQVLDAVRVAADTLANTPAICRKSYVHEIVVTAFEDGVLERFSQTLKDCRSPARRAQVLAQIIAQAT
jgi:DNA topoisomerase-1